MLLFSIVVALLVGVAPMLADGTRASDKADKGGGGMSCCAGDRGGKSMSGSSEAGRDSGSRSGGSSSGGNRIDADRDRSSVSSDRGSKVSAPSGPTARSRPEPSHAAKEVRRAIEHMAKNPDVGNGNEVTGEDGYELGVAAADAYKSWSEQKTKEREQRRATEKAEHEAAAARAIADAKDLAERLKQENEKKNQESQDKPIIQP